MAPIGKDNLGKFLSEESPIWYAQPHSQIHLPDPS